MTDARVALVRIALRAYGQGDVELALALAHPLVRWDERPASPEAEMVWGREKVVDAMRAWMDGWLEYGLKIEELILAGDRVVGCYRERGRERETGMLHDRRRAAVWVVQDGAITDWTVYLTRREAMRAAGVTDEQAEAQHRREAELAVKVERRKAALARREARRRQAAQPSPAAPRTAARAAAGQPAAAQPSPAARPRAAPAAAAGRPAARSGAPVKRPAARKPRSGAQGKPDPKAEAAPAGPKAQRAADQASAPGAAPATGQPDKQLAISERQRQAARRRAALKRRAQARVATDKPAKPAKAG